MMPADLAPVQFLVVKYLSDPVRGEPINVGIVGRVDGRIVLRTLPNFGRVRRIAGVHDTAGLEIGLDFLRSSLDRSPGTDLERLAAEATGIIQFSQVLGGLCDDPEAFIEDQYELYVSDNAAVRSQVVGRRAIRDRIRRALAGRGIDSARFGIWRRSVQGATGHHDFDFGFENGTVTLVRGISLQTSPAYALGEARALSFAVLDTRMRLDAQLRVAAVVTEPLPGEQSPEHDEAVHLIATHADQVMPFEGPEVDQLLGDLFGHEEQPRPLARNLLAGY